MATQVLMPKLGLTMTEGTIEEWKKNEGDAVKEGEVLFSVATDKLTNDIEAETDGTLLKILCAEGETMACKEIIAWIGEPGEEVPETQADAVSDSDKPNAAEAPAEAAPEAAPPKAEGAEKSVIVIGGGVAKGLERYESDLNDRLVAEVYEGQRTVVKITDLKEESGILGAASLFA